MYYERTIVFNEYSGLISKVATTPSLKGIEMLPSIMMPASKPEDFTESLLHFCLHGQLLSSSQRELWYISRIMYVMFKSSGKHCSKIFYSQYLDIYIYIFIFDLITIELYILNFLHFLESRREIISLK